MALSLCISQTDEMEIRKLNPTDAAAYWNLRYEGLQREPLAFGKAAEEHCLTTVEETATRIRDMPAHSFMLGAFADGALVGIATFIRDTGLKERHQGHIYGVYVTAPYRGRGAGKKLVAGILDEVKQDALVEQVLLAVAAHQPAANHLYRSFGFQLYGTQPRALKVGTQYVDENQMILLLR